MVYARDRILQDEYESLMRLNARLLHQHESAKQTFTAGWKACLFELDARLTDSEYTQLRDALIRIDDDHGLPF